MSEIVQNNNQTDSFIAGDVIKETDGEESSEEKDSKNPNFLHISL